MHTRTALLAVLTLSAAPVLAQSPTPPQARPWLSQARTGVSAVTVGDLVLFAGGRRQDATLVDIDVYDNASGQWSKAALQVPRTRMGATVVSANGHTYALFAGGERTGGLYSDAVEVYDASVGPPTDPAAWSLVTLPERRILIAATTVGTKALFAGGATPFGNSDAVEIYDADVGPPTDPAAWSSAKLSRPRIHLSAASAGSQALFAGGFDGGPLADVDIYDDSTGTWSVAMLSQARAGLAGAAVGDRIYFGGGFESFAKMSDVVDVYDTTDGSWSTEHLSVARAFLGATTVGPYVLFAGGVSSGAPTPDATVDVFDTQTWAWLPPSQLSRPRWDVGVTTVGSTAFVAGGSIALDAGGRPIPTPIIDVIDL